MEKGFEILGSHFVFLFLLLNPRSLLLTCEVLVLLFFSFHIYLMVKAAASFIRGVGCQGWSLKIKSTHVDMFTLHVVVNGFPCSEFEGELLPGRRATFHHVQCLHPLKPL